jgi:methylmalonyl-CoA mutase cobalamin-binding domain/chain
MPDRRTTRILLAKIGLDGHDRGVKVLAREFRDAGIDVIYTGLWQTPRATVHAAMQEDVDILGVSLHSAAHMTIMAEVIRWRDKYGIGFMPIVLGGIIPEADYPKLREMGVAAVFNPGSPIATILSTCRELAAQSRRAPLDDVLAGYKAGDVVCLAQLLTHLQRGERPDVWSPSASRAKIIGVTGAPGVGKSSFISRLAGRIRAAGKSVGVVAVDPTSHLSGGALLGDRLRMMSNEPVEEFFVRSLSSGGVSGGLGQGCRPVVEALSGFGFDYVLVETVGAGQTDVEVAHLTEHVLVLLMPQAGDEIQFAKAGIMEIASGLVLNKADLPGAEKTRADLTATVGGSRPIWPVSTLRNEGLEPVAEWALGL